MTDQHIIYANNREQWPEGHWDALSGSAGAPHPNIRCRRMLGTDDGHVVLCGLPVYAGAPDNACIFHTSAPRDHEEVAAALAAANERGVRLNDINLSPTSEPPTQADTESTDAAPPTEPIPPDENVASSIADAVDGIQPAQVGIDAGNSAAADAMDELAAPDALFDDLVESPPDAVPASDDTAKTSADGPSAVPVDTDALSDDLMGSLADSIVEAVADTATPAAPADAPEPGDLPEPTTPAEPAEPIVYINNEEKWPEGLWDELRGEADAPPDHLCCQCEIDPCIGVVGLCGLPVYEGAIDNRCIFHTHSDRNPSKLKIELEAAVGLDARLGFANLVNGRLWDANLEGAQLDFADLSDANLMGADLTNAQLSSATLTGANLFQANLKSVRAPDVKLSCANLNGAKLIDATLYGADLTGADLREADLTRAWLCDANITGADLRGVILSAANARSLDFSGNNLEYVEFAGSNLHASDFADAKLLAADFSDVNLSFANLTGADLRSAKLLGAIDLRDADLRGARLHGFTLSPEARINGVKWSDGDGVIEDERQLRALKIDAEDAKTHIVRQYRECADVYRQIKRCYQTSGEYATAGRFFVREIECERMARALTPPHTVPPTVQLRDSRQSARAKMQILIGELSAATQPVRSQIANAIGDLRALVAESAPDFWAEVEEHARPIRTVATNAAKDICADLKPQIDSAGEWFAQTSVGAQFLRLWKAAYPLLHSTATVFATLIVLAYRNVAPLFVVAGWMLRDAGLLLWQWMAAGLGRILDSELVATPDFIRRGIGPINDWARKGWKWLSHNGTRVVWFLSYHTSKHGEDPMRVVWTMVGTIVAFALSYLIWSPEYTVGGSLINSAEPFLSNFHQALYFSVITFTSLGYGDVKPAPGMCQNLVMLEVFLGVILIALFVGCMIRKISR